MATDKRSFATLRKLPSGRWQVRYTVDGIRRSAPRTFANRMHAEEFAAACRREIDAGKWTMANSVEVPLFAGYSQQWLDERQVAGRPLKARTAQLYQSILDRQLIPVFGTMPLTAITPAKVRSWYAKTLVDHPTRRAHVYSLLRTILNTAVADDIVESNPCRIRGAGAAKRVHTVTPATIAELDALTAKMPAEYALMVPLASWCALRYGEAIELRRGDADVEAGVIRVRRAAVRIRGAYIVDTPKSGAGIRDVHIPPDLIPAVRDHLVQHTGAGAAALLFPSPVGGHLQPWAHQRHWEAARTAIGRDDLRWHDLRHSGAVLAATAGATIAELQARLGHSTAAAALRYQHAAAGSDAALASKLSQLRDAT